MSPTRQLIVRALAVGAGALVLGVVFAAYLRPGMLMEFANFLLCY